MIRLEISGDTAAEFGAQLAAVATLMAGGVTSSSGETPPKPATRTTRSKAAEPAADEGNSSGNAEAAKPSAAASAVSTAQPANASGVDKDSVRAKCVAYGQPTKGGQVALKELLIEAGSPNGKWSEVPDEALPALNARLDELLG